MSHQQQPDFCAAFGQQPPKNWELAAKTFESAPAKIALEKIREREEDEVTEVGDDENEKPDEFDEVASNSQGDDNLASEHFNVAEQQLIGNLGAVSNMPSPVSVDPFDIESLLPSHSLGVHLPLHRFPSRSGFPNYADTSSMSSPERNLMPDIQNTNGPASPLFLHQLPLPQPRQQQQQVVFDGNPFRLPSPPFMSASSPQAPHFQHHQGAVGIHHYQLASMTDSSQPHHLPSSSSSTNSNNVPSSSTVALPSSESKATLVESHSHCVLSVQFNFESSGSSKRKKASQDCSPYERPVPLNFDLPSQFSSLASVPLAFRWSAQHSTKYDEKFLESVLEKSREKKLICLNEEGLDDQMISVPVQSFAVPGKDNIVVVRQGVVHFSHTYGKNNLVERSGARITKGREHPTVTSTYEFRLDLEASSRHGLNIHGLHQYQVNVLQELECATIVAVAERHVYTEANKTGSSSPSKKSKRSK